MARSWRESVNSKGLLPLQCRSTLRAKPG